MGSFSRSLLFYEAAEEANDPNWRPDLDPIIDPTIDTFDEDLDLLDEAHYEESPAAEKKR